MTCLIIEDQPPAQRILKKYISDLGTLELRGTYADPLLAADHLRNERVDILLLDINLPKLSGLDFIKTLSYSPAVILTTAYSEYALEGFELDVVDYLLKPFSFQRFVKAVNKVTDRPAAAPGAEQQPQSVFIKSGYEHIRVDLDRVLYLRAGSDYTELVTPQKKHLSTDTLRFWLGRLPPQFVRVHKSYAVNIDHVERVIGNEIFLPDHVTVPIGRAYKEPFMQQLMGE
jgi:DNA-binding LytR/AlgR family response regulator